MLLAVIPGDLFSLKQNSLKALNDGYIKMFCSKFGGCTTYDANGYWASPDGVLYEDETLVCETFVDVDKWFNGDMDEFLADCKATARHYKREAKQEAVSIVVDGEAFII